MSNTKLTRDQIRAELVGNKRPLRKELVTLFGMEIELRQPTLGAILEARMDSDEKTRTTDIFIRYAYVPNTDEKVFEDTDRAAILEWPFDEDVLKVQMAIAKLTGIDVSGQIEEIKTDPLEGSS